MSCVSLFLPSSRRNPCQTFRLSTIPGYFIQTPRITHLLRPHVCMALRRSDRCPGWSDLSTTGLLFTMNLSPRRLYQKVSQEWHLHLVTAPLAWDTSSTGTLTQHAIFLGNPNIPTARNNLIGKLYYNGILAVEQLHRFQSSSVSTLRRALGLRGVLNMKPVASPA